MLMCGREIIPSTPEPKKIIDTEGRVERFMRKYGMLEGNASEQQSSKEK